MSFKEVFDEIRKLKKELATERARRNQTMVTGTIEEVKGSKVRIRIADDGSDGEPVLSPWIRMAQNTGHRGKGVSKFTKYGVGESVMVVSPNGKLGAMSAAMPWISTEDDPSPGTAENDGDVTTMGDTKFEQRDGCMKMTMGALSIEMNGDTIAITGNVQINGEILKHNAKSISDTHKHTGVEPGGGQSSVPV
jgi:phage baseplate assembly protein gpV